MKYVIHIFECSKLFTSNTTDIHVPINTFYYQYRDLNSVLLRILNSIFYYRQMKRCLFKQRCVLMKTSYIVYTNIQSYS